VSEERSSGVQEFEEFKKRSQEPESRSQEDGGLPRRGRFLK